MSDDQSPATAEPAESVQATPNVEAAAAADLAKTDPARAYEESLPDWQKKLNHQAEGWLFAVIVALVIRQFFLEPFSIPTTSMEPTLLGEPSIMGRDFVLVDKLTHRFTGTKRWEVTVFQYPVPEIDTGWGRNANAERGVDKRIDSFPMQPLLERNFVKRTLVVPGDVFYIANGDVFVYQEELPEGQQPDPAKFAVLQKPDHVQESLWLPVYKAGHQEGYLPWAEGTAVQQDGLLELTTTSAQPATFTQPLNNLYVKDATIGVRSIGTLGSVHMVTASNLEPQFGYIDRNGKMVTGSIWDTHLWELRRYTTAELKKVKAGKEQAEDRKFLINTSNGRMNERVGDIRLTLGVGTITGAPVLRINEGVRNMVDLALTDGGWVLRHGQAEADLTEVASGAASLAGAVVQVVLLDDVLRLVADGDVLAEAPLHAADPQSSALGIQVRGDGALSLSECSVDRDVHYSKSGFLIDESYYKLGEYRDGPRKLDLTPQSFWSASKLLQGQTEWQISAKSELHNKLYRYRGEMLASLVDDTLRTKMLASRDRYMERQASSELNWLKPIGYSPETALRAPDTGYLMLGDNSPYSLDGRNWGWVPEANLRGEVLWVVWWPWRWKVVR